MIIEEKYEEIRIIIIEPKYLEGIETTPLKIIKKENLDWNRFEELMIIGSIKMNLIDIVIKEAQVKTKKINIGKENNIQEAKAVVRN